MRSKNALKNLSFHLLYEGIVFILGIIFPRFIILTYGSEINGLTATLTRLLSLISLIQAGAVGAAIFQMYKPVAENDYDTQSAIIFSSKKYYRIITQVYLLLSLVVGVYCGYHLGNQGLHFTDIFFSFIILAINGAGMLYFGSVCDIFLSPHQKKYYISIAMICEQIVRYSLTAIVLIFHLHFLFIYLSFLAGGIVCIIIQITIFKKFSKSIIDRNPDNKHYLIPNRRYLMLTCVGTEAITASPSVIIATVEGLVSASVFSLYSMIFMSMRTIINSIQLSFSAIFGNLVKTSDDNHIYRVYSLIELITISVGTICSVGIAFLIIPFIKLYSVGFHDADYLIPILGLFIVFYTFVFSFRSAYGFVITVYGLFKEMCIISLGFGILGIAISFICVLFYGMPYVMVGLLFNQVGCAVSSLILIVKRIKWFSFKKLLQRGIVMIVITITAVIAYYCLKPGINSWFEWVINGVIVVLFSVTIIFLYCLLFERENLKMLFSYLKNVFSI